MLSLSPGPKSPTILCGGSGDPTVNFAINAQTAYNGFISRGVTIVSLVDVDSEIQQEFGGGVDPTYEIDYHGLLERPFCLQKAKQSFDLYR